MNELLLPARRSVREMARCAAVIVGMTALLTALSLRAIANYDR